MLIKKTLAHNRWFFILSCSLSMLACVLFQSYQYLLDTRSSNDSMYRQLLQHYLENGNSDVDANLIFTSAKEDFPASFICFLNSDGKILFQRGAVPVRDISFYFEQTRNTSFYPGAFTQLLRLFDNERYGFAARASLSSGVSYVLISDASNNEWYGALRLLPYEALLIILPPLLFFLYSSRRVYRKLNRLVAAIAGKARAIASGDYSERLQFHEPNELQPIADSYNQMAEKIQEKTAALAAFFGNIAHEIRSPLHGIKLAADMIAGDSSGNAENRELASMIAENSGRIAALAESLLLLARIDAADYRAQLQMSTVNLPTIVNNALRDAQPQINSKKLQLTLGALPETSVSGNEPLLYIMIKNLIDNAVKFTPSGGNIAINGKLYGKNYQLEILDSGPGIPAADLPRLFERLYRSTATAKIQGSGLGLAIVKRIAELHNGSVHIENNKGRGALAQLTLPAAN